MDCGRGIYLSPVFPPVSFPIEPSEPRPLQQCKKPESKQKVLNSLGCVLSISMDSVFQLLISG
jgi:hypothetical protein